MRLDTRIHDHLAVRIPLLSFNVDIFHFVFIIIPVYTAGEPQEPLGFGHIHDLLPYGVSQWDFPNVFRVPRMDNAFAASNSECNRL